MAHNVFISHSARTQSKWIARSFALVMALLGTARDAAPQPVQAIPHEQASGAFIADLRKHGLDIVLVIDGTGSMNLIIDDLKAGMPQLVQSIHGKVPIARIGIVVFGGKGEKRRSQPLTLSAQKLTDFLSTIPEMGGGEWKDDTLGACQSAIEETDWKPGAKKILVLVGDSPPEKEDFAPLLALIRKFKDNNGTFNAVNVAAEEHERYELDFWLKHDHKAPLKLSPLPEFYRQTFPAYGVLATSGGGHMQELRRHESIDQVIFRLIFDQRWQPQPQQPQPYPPYFLPVLCVTDTRADYFPAASGMGVLPVIVLNQCENLPHNRPSRNAAAAFRLRVDTGCRGHPCRQPRRRD